MLFSLSDNGSTQVCPGREIVLAANSGRNMEKNHFCDRKIQTMGSITSHSSSVGWREWCPKSTVWKEGMQENCSTVRKPERGAGAAPFNLQKKSYQRINLAENVSASACILTSSLPHSRGTKKYPNATSSCIFQIAPHSFSAPPLTSTLDFSFQKQHNHTCSFK